MQVQQHLISAVPRRVFDSKMELNFRLAIVLVLGVIYLVGINATSPDTGQEVAEREERQVSCRVPPPNASGDCIVCNGEATFQLTENCWCDVCRPGTYMASPCICSANGTVETLINCMPGEFEKGYMPVSNWCDEPYPCTECEGDLVPVSECGGADDRRCDCPENQYQTGLTTCQDIPRCPKDYQSQRVPVPGLKYVQYLCEPCEDGFEQPEEDSLDKCRVIITSVTENPVSGTSKSALDTASPAPLKTEEPISTPSDKKDQHITNCTSECPCPACPKMECPTEKAAIPKHPTACIDKTDNDGKEKLIEWPTPVTIFLIIAIFVCSLISLVYGSKHPDDIKSKMSWLRINRWIYNEHSTDSFSTGGLRTESVGSLTDVTTDPSESPSERDSLTGHANAGTDIASNGNGHVPGDKDDNHPVFDGSKTTGGRRGKAQQKYVRGRSKNHTRVSSQT